MANIQGYTSQVLAQGGINTRSASAADFGVDTSGLAQGIAGMSREINQQIEADDVTNVRVQMAKARSEWAQALQDREAEAVPGDRTFAPKLASDMEQYFSSGAEVARTAKGRQVWNSLAAEMTSEFSVRATGVQAKLAGEGARNQFNELKTYATQTVAKDFTQYDAVRNEMVAAVDDPNSIFGQIPETHRREFKRLLTQEVAYEAAMNYVAKNPGATVKSLPAEMQKDATLYEGYLKGNAVPGGQLNVAKSVMQYAPTVTEAASARGVNPNIMLAQIDQESKGNPGAVSPKGATGVSQFMPGTAARYGVDVKDPVSSIKGQAAYMSDLLRMFGGDYTKALAGYNWGEGNVAKAMQRYGDAWLQHAPAETQNYVKTVMQRAGAVPNSDTQVQPVGPQTPVAKVNTNLPFFNELSGEQQRQIINEDIRLTNLRRTMEEHARIDAERKQQKIQESTMNSFTTRILDPENNGGLPSQNEIANNPNLTSQQKQHMAQFMMRSAQEIDGAAHPTKVRELLGAIHAADGDPTKTYSEQPVFQAYMNGEISKSEYMFLRKEVEGLRDGGTNPFTKQMQQARAVAEGALTRSIIGQMQPELAYEAAYRFNLDMQQKIDQYRKEGKDPRSLLDPGSRDYLLRPERINSFMPQADAAMAQQAQKEIEAAKGDKTAAPGFEIGKSYTVNGKNMTYVGGPVNLSTSWKS